MTEFERDLVKQKNATDKAVSLIGSHFKSHAIDYVLVCLICLILGLFDAFVLKRSKNIFDENYWYHAICRVSAFTLATILGIRVGYPKAKANNTTLALELKKNKRLLELRDNTFDAYIYNVNVEIKKEAWKNKILRKIRRLEKRSHPAFEMFYKTKSEIYFTNYRKRKRKRLLRKANKYVEKRTYLDLYLTEDYINENIDRLNVKYYRIYVMDFEMLGESDESAYYKTRSAFKKSSSQTVLTSFLITAIVSLILGSIALEFSQELFENKVLGIISMVTNTLFDIAMTLWRYSIGFADGDRIVNQEDLQPCLNRNRLLTKYLNDNNIAIPSFKNEELKNLEV